MAGGVTGAESREAEGSPAVVGPDGIPELHVHTRAAGSGRTWRLADSPTVFNLPPGLEVRAWGRDDLGDGVLAITSDAIAHTVYVHAETAVELESHGGGFLTAPPCDDQSTIPYHLVELFDQMRASIRIQPIAP